MLCQQDIWKLNMFTFLRPYEAKVRRVYERHGTSAAKDYIYKIFRMKMKRAEIREFLGVNTGGNSFFKEVHRVAWSTCGWNGSYCPIAAHRHMDTSKKEDKEIELTNEITNKDTESQVMVNQNTVNLLSAELLSSGCKLNIK